MSLPSIQDGVVHAMQAAPIQAGHRGALSVIGRGISYILSLGKDKIQTLGLEGIISLLENGFQLAVVDVNFPQVPDFIEDPVEAWAKTQIRPLVTSLFGSLFSAGS